jgi:integrase
MANLENDILPAIGNMNISEITPREILNMLRKIEARGAGQTAHRTRSQCSMIFRYGIATERCTSDPCRDLVDALKPTTKKHRAAITDMARLSELLRAIDGYRGTAIVKAALKLAPLLAVRPGELRFAKWKDVNFETREWTLVAEKTKVDHIVPLPHQAIEILKDLQKITYEDDDSYLFPQLNRKGRVMSENTLTYALRGLGFSGEEMTAHGFRTTTKTELLELGYPLAWTEKMLAHGPKETHGRAYNRTEYRQQRHQMMQAWADYLDELRSEKDVNKLRRKYKYNE